MKSASLSLDSLAADRPDFESLWQHYIPAHIQIHPDAFEWLTKESLLRGLSVDFLLNAVLLREVDDTE